MKKIRICSICKIYTFLEGHCNKITNSAHPHPFNPNDPYAKYRRMEKGYL